MKKIVLVAFAFAAIVLNGAMKPGEDRERPHYLRVLANLRDARWMIDHVPANSWKESNNEKAAVNCIDDAIARVKEAAIDDKKDVNDHSFKDEMKDHLGRLAKAGEFLKDAHKEVKDADDGYSNGLKKKVLTLIDQASAAVDRAKEENRK